MLYIALLIVSRSCVSQGERLSVFKKSFVLIKFIITIQYNIETELKYTRNNSYQGEIASSEHLISQMHGSSGSNQDCHTFGESGVFHSSNAWQF